MKLIVCYLYFKNSIYSDANAVLKLQPAITLIQVLFAIKEQQIPIDKRCSHFENSSYSDANAVLKLQPALTLIQMLFPI